MNSFSLIEYYFDIETKQKLLINKEVGSFVVRDQTEADILVGLFDDYNNWLSTDGCEFEVCDRIINYLNKLSACGFPNKEQFK